jgi:hypothetical protein
MNKVSYFCQRFTLAAESSSKIDIVFDFLPPHAEETMLNHSLVALKLDKQVRRRFWQSGFKFLNAL